MRKQCPFNINPGLLCHTSALVDRAGGILHNRLVRVGILTLTTVLFYKVFSTNITLTSREHWLSYTLLIYFRKVMYSVRLYFQNSGNQHTILSELTLWAKVYLKVVLLLMWYCFMLLNSELLLRSNHLFTWLEYLYNPPTCLRSQVLKPVKTCRVFYLVIYAFYICIEFNITTLSTEHSEPYFMWHFFWFIIQLFYKLCPVPRG